MEEVVKKYVDECLGFVKEHRGISYVCSFLRETHRT